MTSSLGENEILVTDARGRVRLTRERKAELLAEFDRSGMTIRRFTQWSGISYQTFCGWLARRKKAAKLSLARTAQCNNPPAARWAEAVVEPVSEKKASGSVTVVFPGNATMEIADGSSAMMAAELLRQWANLAGSPRSC